MFPCSSDYDGGDCCECTCEDRPGTDTVSEIICGEGARFACIDPEAPCVEDDDITADMEDGCGYLVGIGNGHCDQGNNKEVCGRSYSRRRLRRETFIAYIQQLAS